MIVDEDTSVRSNLTFRVAIAELLGGAKTYDDHYRKDQFDKAPVLARANLKTWEYC